MSATVDIALLPAFVEVVRQGSFTSAADVLGVPKSTVSRRVTRLEKELGVQLLVRTTRQLRLTEAGQLFYDRVAPSVEAVEEAARAVLEQEDEPRGHLRMTAPPDSARALAGVVLEFTARYPDVTVELSLSGEVVDLVAEGFDMAVRAGRMPDSSLVARKLADDELRLCASPGYLARAGIPKTVAELAEHRCVAFRSRDGTQRWVFEGPDGRHEVDVRGPIVADSFAFIASAVAEGAGIGLLPRLAMPEGVVCVLHEYGAPTGGIYIVYPGARHVPAKVRAMRDLLVEAFPAHLLALPGAPPPR